MERQAKEQNIEDTEEQKEQGEEEEEKLGVELRY